MNNIQEMDWAEDCWHGHTGMDSSCDYCILDEKDKKKPPAEPEPDSEDTKEK